MGKLEPVIVQSGTGARKEEQSSKRPARWWTASARPWIRMPAVRKAGLLLEEARAVVTKAGAFVEPGGRCRRPAPTCDRGGASPDQEDFAGSGGDYASRPGAGGTDGCLVNEAGEKARARLEQIDRSVEDTIEQVEKAGGAIKRAAVRPVREVNGIAAGISAAVATRCATAEGPAWIPRRRTRKCSSSRGRATLTGAAAGSTAAPV